MLWLPKDARRYDRRPVAAFSLFPPPHSKRGSLSFSDGELDEHIGRWLRIFSPPPPPLPPPQRLPGPHLHLLPTSATHRGSHLGRRRQPRIVLSGRGTKAHGELLICAPPSHRGWSRGVQSSSSLPSIPPQARVSQFPFALPFPGLRESRSSHGAASRAHCGTDHVPDDSGLEKGASARARDILGTASWGPHLAPMPPSHRGPGSRCLAGTAVQDDPPSLALAPPPRSAFSPFPPPSSRCLSGAHSLVPGSRVRDGGSRGHHLLLTIGIASGAQPCDLGYSVDWRACPWPGPVRVLFLAPTVPSLFCPTEYSRLPFWHGLARTRPRRVSQHPQARGTPPTPDDPDIWLSQQHC